MTLSKSYRRINRVSYIFDLTNKIFVPYTLIYVLRDSHILLIKRDKLKKTVPDKWTGLGGKIEHGERIDEAAKRETVEESGLTPIDIDFRGTFTWVNEKTIIGTLYLFMVTDFTGSLATRNREGVLDWHPIDSLASLKDIAIHQLLFLPQIISDQELFYSGFAIFKNGALVSHIANTGQTMSI